MSGWLLLVLFITTDVLPTANTNYVGFKVNTTDIGKTSAYSNANILDYTIPMSTFGITVKGKTFFTFEVRACADAHVFLSSSSSMMSSKPLYQIGLGSYENQRILIRRRSDDSLMKDTFNETYFVFMSGILDCASFTPVVIYWDNGTIQIDTTIDGNDVSVKWTDNNPFLIENVGICTTWGSNGEWKIKDNSTGHLILCGTGKANLPSVKMSVTSKAHCAVFCGYGCIGFNYESKTKRCELLTFGEETPTDIVQKAENSWVFYAKCFGNTGSCLGCFF